MTRIKLRRNLAPSAAKETTPIVRTRPVTLAGNFEIKFRELDFGSQFFALPPGYMYRTVWEKVDELCSKKIDEMPGAHYKAFNAHDTVYVEELTVGLVR